MAESGSEWLDPGRADAWPAYRARLPHAAEGEAMLIEHLVPDGVTRILDLGTGDGHLLEAIGRRFPEADAVGLDLSPAMIAAARDRLAGVAGVELGVHDLIEPIPDELGDFDLVVSGLAIHHLPDERKRRLYAEAHGRLRPGGAFYNLDCVSSPTPELNALSQAAFGFDQRDPDPSDQLAPLEDQLEWLREAGFDQVDCHWKWLELALFGGVRTR